MSRLPAEQEAALRAAEAKATPGPWASQRHIIYKIAEADGLPDMIAECGPTRMSSEQELADASFIVEARNTMPALLDELKVVRAERAAIAEAVFAIAKSADGGHSYEVTLTNMQRAVSAAIDVVGKNGGQR